MALGNNNVSFNGSLYARAYNSGVKNGPQSSAPSITNAENKIQDKIAQLEKRPTTTIKELQEGKFRPQINSDGLFTTCGLPYTGVIRNADSSLVEYKDGKPITIVKDVANDNAIHKTIIQYEYPQGSIAALKTETTVIQETNHKKGCSFKVPYGILEESGILHSLKH